MNILITGGKSGIAKRVIEKLGNKQLKLANDSYQNMSWIEPIKLDITNSKEREQVKKLNIDVLICNAAIGFGGSMFEIPTSLLRKNFEVNVFSNVELVQEIVKEMLKKDGGRIIFISSLASYIPVPFLGSYSATKASINIISGAMRIEAKLLPKKIKIITVLPGLYYTGFNQVMVDNKYDWMDIDSYFNAYLEFLKKYENKFYHLLETSNLDSIANKIVLAATSKYPKSIYRSRPSQIIFTKLYQIFFT